MDINKFVILLLCCFVLTQACKKTEEMKTSSLFVGTYTENGSEGIYYFDLDSETGKLNNKKLSAVIDNPSFLKISNNKKYLYAVEETNEYKNESGGLVAFSIVKDSLVKLNADTTLGAHPCHIGLSKDGKFLAASSYTGGSVCIFKLDSNGALMPNSQKLDHKVLDSIKTSHAHASIFTPDGLFTADLGLDALKRYNYQAPSFVPAKQASINFPDGAGPRHFVFGKQEAFLYVINELNSTITVFQKNKNGNYKSIETQSTLDKNFKGKSFCADIHLSQDGKFLYGSNRGENTIVIFKVDSETGKLQLVGREGVQGNWPRNFAIDPTNKFLLVANKKSNNITIFKRDSNNGRLTFLHEVQISSPVCIEFID